MSGESENREPINFSLQNALSLISSPPLSSCLNSQNPLVSCVSARIICASGFSHGLDFCINAWQDICARFRHAAVLASSLLVSLSLNRHQGTSCSHSLVTGPWPHSLLPRAGSTFVSCVMFLLPDEAFCYRGSRWGSQLNPGAPEPPGSNSESIQLRIFIFLSLMFSSGE